MSDLDSVVLGIDLGTTNSVLSILQENHPIILPVAGQRLLPSVVGVSPDGTILVGHPARNQWAVSPERTVRSIKRRMGSDEKVTMAGRDYSPQEISAFVLGAIKEAAQAALGHEVVRAVVTVPAYFDETQRQATLEAGEIAGLQVERIINEPTAAALAYGYGLETGAETDEQLRILVYDLGGGTFDVSIIEFGYGVVDVLATAGDNQLGGDDFDERLATVMAARFHEEQGIDLTQDHRAWARLLQAAEEAKIGLSSQPFVNVDLEYIAEDSTGLPLHLRQEYSRQEFENLIDDLLARTVDAIDTALTDAELTQDQIDRVLLVGGSTRIPAVWELVTERMGQDPHAEIDPDAAVALGAAIQGGIIAGAEIDAILVDVTPLSLGIETATFSNSGQVRADQFAVLIRRNTTIPVQQSRLFTTLFPGQSEVMVNVYQGEDPIASNNTSLGNFMAQELQANRPDGLAEIMINFALDINGILDVTVVDRKSGKQTREQLKASRQRLSPEQIAASQAHLAGAYDGVSGESDEVVEVDPGVAALLNRAERALAQPGADPDRVSELRNVMQQIRHFAALGEEDAVEAYSDELIDLLFELEE